MATSVRMISTMITSGGPLPELPLPSVANGNDAGVDGVSELGVVSATAGGVSDGVGVELGVGLGVGGGVGGGVGVLDGAITGPSESCTGLGVGLAAAVTVTEPTPHLCGGTSEQ
jgi:hypothetical protein